ncbi:T9SS type A sorting domain-containing protein [candidate division WOR-3 bacterium]|nr:T9SS type A sorting domain-containing protein [candidate division WOR-3 bacterium]
MAALLYIAFMAGYIYEDSDSLIVYNDTLTMCGQHIYNHKIHIADTARLLVRTWTGSDSTGWLVLNAPDIRIEGLSAICGHGAGYWGGTNTHPDGYGPGYGVAGNLGGGAGGGAGYGGTGGNGGGSPGTGGIVYGNSSDTLIQMGSGGGAGRLGGVEGFGGNGGAAICIRAGTLAIDSSLITANGETGDTAAMVAGGGGSGGGIMLWADSIMVNGTALEANGGPGGPVDPEYGFGGGGAGGGRVKIFYTTFIDTSALSISAQGGDAGIGGYGNGQPGLPGTIYVDQIVSVLEVVHETSVMCNIEPSPARNMVHITIGNPPLQLALCDALGRVVMILRLNQITETINLADLSAGVYFLKSDRGHGVLAKIVLLR